MTTRVGYLIGQFPAINHHYLLQEIHHLRKAGLDVRIASISNPDRPVAQLEPDERALMPEIYFVKQQSRLGAATLLLATALRRPLRLFAAVRRAWSIARAQGRHRRYGVYYLAEALLVTQWAERSGISHLHASFTSTIALLVKDLGGPPMSFGVYGLGELYDPLGSRLAVKIQEATFVRSVSRHGMAQLMLASSPDQWPKLKYLRLGIQPEEFPPLDFVPARAFELVSVGRLAPEKGHRLLIAALARVVSRHDSVVLRIVGDGPDRRELEADVARRRLAGRVVFEGWVDQERLKAIYNSASACVLGSMYEGTPIVLMEAMARAIPCIAPAVGGIPELIVHGRTGLLFDPGDDEGLADGLIRLIESPDLARHLAQAGRDLVLGRYDIARNTQELAELFRSCTTGSDR